MAVLIPARNEEELLPRCLQSVARACGALPPDVTWDVIVVSDGSTDRTEELARQLLGSHGAVVQGGAGCVGLARSMAAVIALQRYTGLRSRCWFANTDADCEVPETWLTDQLSLARKGIMAVAGIIDVQDFSEHLPVVETRFRISYQVHRDGTHPHIHGANLGVRSDAYLLSGGWQELNTAEDHDLWARLRACGALLQSDARLRVLTSGRRVGRAPSGFADALAAHNAMVTV